jgi:chromosome segregation ATPase
MNQPFSKHLRAGQSAAATALLLLAAATSLRAQATPVDAVASTRSTLEQWVATRSLVSTESRDWLLAKEALTARMDVIKREIVEKQKRTAEAEKGLADADRKRAELQADSERLTASVAGLETRIGALESRLLRTLARLPDPLRDKL